METQIHYFYEKNVNPENPEIPENPENPENPEKNQKYDFEKFEKKYYFPQSSTSCVYDSSLHFSIAQADHGEQGGQTHPTFQVSPTLPTIRLCLHEQTLASRQTPSTIQKFLDRPEWVPIR